MRNRLGRPSPALVISIIALFVALGGTGYAAATGSIDSREIKNSSIQSKDVKNSSLTGGDVKNNSLTGSDVTESSLAKVPSAGRADSAGSAATASSASTLAGQPPAAFASANVGRAFSTGTNTDLDAYPTGTVLSLSLPAGRYAVMAQISHDNDTNAAENNQCRLQGGGMDNHADFGPDGAGGADNLNVSLNGLASSTIPFNVTVSCDQVGGDDSILSRHMTAVRVAD